MQDSPYYASIDCGQKGVICLWDSDFDEFETFSMPMLDKRIIDGDTLAYLLLGVEQVFIELQYTKKNQRGMITNIMNYGIAYHSARLVTDNVEEVSAIKWVTAMNLHNPKGRNLLLPKKTKATRIKEVKRLLGYDCATHDEADSILIGLYAKEFLL